MNYSEQARQVAAAFWDEDQKRAVRLAAVEDMHRRGVITDDYLRQQRDKAAAERSAARVAAQAKLDELKKTFSAQLESWGRPAARVLDNPDFKILQSGLPISLANFRASCRKYRDDASMAAALRQYAGPRGWLAYANVDMPDTGKRQAAFDRVLVRAQQDVSAADRGHAVANTPELWQRYTAGADEVLGELSTPHYESAWTRAVAAKGGIAAACHAEAEASLAALFEKR